MGRIRTIKPELPQSESMGRVTRDARLCFIMLWTIADDSGRLRGASRMLASLLFPYDDDAPGLIDKWLAELEAEKCIIRYEIEDQHYIQIVNWCEHQKIDKPSTSKIPPFERIREDSPKAREESCLDQGSRIKDQGKERSAPPTKSVDSRETVNPEEASAGFILDDDPEPTPKTAPVDIPERYVDAVYEAWVELGEKVYQPSSLWQFQQVWGRDVAPYVKGIHSTDVLAAIGNFRTIVTAPKGTYFWSMRIGIGQFFSRHLDRFLPKNFKAEDFLPRLSFKDQEAAETAAAMEAVFGKKGVEA